MTPRSARAAKCSTGLLRDRGWEYQAKNNVDDLLYDVQTLGFVPNANASWGQNRSQPAYLSMMVRGVYEQMNPKDAN